MGLHSFAWADFWHAADQCQSVVQGLGTPNLNKQDFLIYFYSHSFWCFLFFNRYIFLISYLYIISLNVIFNSFFLQNYYFFSSCSIPIFSSYLDVVSIIYSTILQSSICIVYEVNPNKLTISHALRKLYWKQFLWKQIIPSFIWGAYKQLVLKLFLL